MAHFSFDKFNKWENETHIPADIMKMAQVICKEIGVEFEEETVREENIYGDVYGYMKGFRLTHCTSSLADGPSPDYSDAVAKWLIGLGFEKVSSHGDNGMDSATNWHDTYWTDEFGYTPTEVFKEKFYESDPTDYEDENYDGESEEIPYEERLDAYSNPQAYYDYYYGD